jgi:transcriptional regulator with XRE-family HTH domain
MKKNPRLEERRKLIPTEIDLFVTRSFDIVDRIQEILILKQLDQKDLADLLEKKESEISKWMSGTHNFTIKTIARIEKVLGSSIVKVVRKESQIQKHPTLFLVKKEYAHFNQGKKINIGESQEIEIRSKFQKATSYLS